MIFDSFRRRGGSKFFRQFRKYFSRPLKQESAGTITFFQSSPDEAPLVLLIQRAGNYKDWSFPKGKVEKNRPLPDEAVRETLEEVGLQVKILAKLPSNKYTFFVEESNHRVSTEVHYFLAKSETQKYKLQESVASKESQHFISASWVSFDSAISMVKHKREKEILKAAKEYLRIAN